MKATLNGRVIATSDDVVACDGYAYFPASTVRREWLEKSPKTDDDRACPHGVQFYDIMLDGTRHRRVAWSYERAQREIKEVGGRFGFWNAVQVL